MNLHLRHHRAWKSARTRVWAARIAAKSSGEAMSVIVGATGAGAGADMFSGGGRRLWLPRAAAG